MLPSPRRLTAFEDMASSPDLPHQYSMDSHFSTYSSATLVNQCDSDEDFDFKRSDEPLNGNPKLGAPFIKLENISSNDPDVPLLSIESAQRPDSNADTSEYPQCPHCSWSPRAVKGRPLQNMRQAVQKHIKRNHQSRDYECEVCHQTISKRRDNVKSHIRRKHPDRFTELYPESANTKAPQGRYHTNQITHLEADQAGLGDPKPDTSWRATKFTNEPPPGRHASPHEPFLRAIPRDDVVPERDDLNRAIRAATPVEATRNFLAPKQSSEPLETGEKPLQSARPFTAISDIQSGTGLVGRSSRHESPLHVFIKPKPAATAQVAEGSHTQAVKPPESPLASWESGVYNPSYRPASEGDKPAQSSVESSWDSDINRQSYQRWYSIATSSRRVDNTIRDQSLATESQASTGTVMTDDTVQLSWTFDNRFLMRSSHPFLSVELDAVQEVVKYFQVWNLGGGGAAASETLRYSSSASSETRRQEKGKGPQKRPVGDSDEPGENGEDGPPPKKQSRKKVTQGQPRLACHFQKRFPERHPLCGGYLMIAHVKQHLRLKHTRSPYYCPRCNIEFKTEEERDEHIELIVSSPCQKRVYDMSTEISARVAKQLQKRVESARGLYEQWFSVWDTIFPGIVRPATCTYDICSELPVQVLGLYSYLENEGPGAVISVLQRHGLSITSESLQPMPLDLQTYIRRVLFQACREICQNWQTQREQSSSPNSIHSNTRGARTSVEPSPQNRTNAAPYTPTSITNEGSSSASNIQAETSIIQVRCVSESGAQSQPDHRSLRTPMATLDSNSNDNGFLWCTSTATYGAGTLDGYIPQYETFSTLQYPVENVHMADDVFDFDLSMPQHFSSGNRDLA